MIPRDPSGSGLLSPGRFAANIARTLMESGKRGREAALIRAAR
jgi:hypothetical protein